MGLDAGVTDRITVALDFLDQWIINGQRTFARSFTAADRNVYPTLIFPYESRHEYNGSAGVKVALPRDVQFTWNVLFRMNQAGLRARVVPMLGLSFVF